MEFLCRNLKGTDKLSLWEDDIEQQDSKQVFQAYTEKIEDRKHILKMMEEDDILREILLELRESRLKQKKTISSMNPTGSYAVNMDFASLYPSTMTMIFGKHTRRKSKISRLKIRFML